MSTLGRSKIRACYSVCRLAMTNYLNKQFGMGEVCFSLSILRCQSVLGSWQRRVQVFGCVEHQGGRTFGRVVCLPRDWQETHKDEGSQSKPSKAYPPGTHFLQLSLTSRKSTSRSQSFIGTWSLLGIIDWKTTRSYSRSLQHPPTI